MFRTHVSRVAPRWDLSDALPTEPQRCGTAVSFWIVLLRLNLKEVAIFYVNLVSTCHPLFNFVQLKSKAQRKYSDSNYGSSRSKKAVTAMVQALR